MPRGAPALERLWRLRRDRGLVVIGIASGESADTVRRFLRRLDPAPSFAMAPDRRAKDRKSEDK